MYFLADNLSTEWFLISWLDGKRLFNSILMQYGAAFRHWWEKEAEVHWLLNAHNQSSPTQWDYPRYDKLLSTYGGDDIPACSFGFGDSKWHKICFGVFDLWC